MAIFRGAGTTGTGGPSDLVEMVQDALGEVVQSVTPRVQRFSGNGTTTQFTLDTWPGAEENTMVFINGVYQNKDTYSLNAAIVVFSVAPPVGTNNIEIITGPASQLVNYSSSGVTYLANGTGAIVNNVQDKLRETVSVKDFGAVGDGVTDDTAAIQAAIDAATTFTSAIFFPEGDYVTSSSIVLKDNITIVGVCRGAVRFLNCHPNGTFTLANNVRIENITIETDSDPTHWAFVGFNTSKVSMFQTDILGGSFFSTKSKALKITGNTWATLLVYECIWDIGLETGEAVYISGNPTTPQNIDTHFRDVFLDTLKATTGGGFYFKDVFAPRISNCLVRTRNVGSGFNIKLERTNTNDTSPCDLLVEASTLEFGTPSIFVGDGCTCLIKGATFDSVTNNGKLVRFSEECVYTLPTQNDFSWVNQGTATIYTDTLGQQVLFQEGHASPTSLSLRTMPCPSGNFRLSACINGGDISKEYLKYGIGFRESSTNKLVFYGLVPNVSGALQLTVAKYSNTSTFVANYLAVNAYTSGDCWLRINRDSGGLGFSNSNNGTAYYEIFSTTLTNFFTTGPDQIFFAIDAENAAPPDFDFNMAMKSWLVESI